MKKIFWYLKNDIYEILKEHIVRIQNNMNMTLKRSDENNIEFKNVKNYILNNSDIIILKLTYDLFFDKTKLNPIIQIAFKVCSQYLLTSPLKSENVMIKGLFIASILAFIADTFKLYIPEPLVYLDKLIDNIFIQQQQSLKNEILSIKNNYDEILSIDEVIGINSPNKYSKLINSTFKILNTCIETYSQNNGFAIIFKKIEDKLKWILLNERKEEMSPVLSQIKEIVDSISKIKEEQLNKKSERESSSVSIKGDFDNDSSLNLIRQEELMIDYGDNVNKQNKRLRKKIKREKTKINSELRKDAIIVTNLKRREKGNLN